MQSAAATALLDETGDTMKVIRNAIVVPGPVGPLEAVLTRPADDAPLRAVAAIAHPHPLHGGTLNNKVVHYLAKTFNDLGAAAVRFNFRGVGQSAGGYGEGIGETEDLLAVYDWLGEQFPQTPIWLAGFSFGAYTSLRAATLRPAAGLICVAPPVHLFDMTELPEPNCPWLIVQGDRDMVVSYAQVTNWISTLHSPVTFVPMAGVGHFFHGQLNALQDKVTRFLRDRLP